MFDKYRRCSAKIEVIVEIGKDYPTVVKNVRSCTSQLLKYIEWEDFKTVYCKCCTELQQVFRFVAFTGPIIDVSILFIDTQNDLTKFIVDGCPEKHLDTAAYQLSCLLF